MLSLSMRSFKIKAGHLPTQPLANLPSDASSKKGILKKSYVQKMQNLYFFHEIVMIFAYFFMFLNLNIFLFSIIFLKFDFCFLGLLRSRARPG